MPGMQYKPFSAAEVCEIRCPKYYTATISKIKITLLPVYISTESEVRTSKLRNLDVEFIFFLFTTLLIIMLLMIKSQDQRSVHRYHVGHVHHRYRFENSSTIPQGPVRSFWHRADPDTAHLDTEDTAGDTEEILKIILMQQHCKFHILPMNHLQL